MKRKVKRSEEIEGKSTAAEQAWVGKEKKEGAFRSA